MEEQNVNHPIDEAAERDAFERIISAPPYEHMCDTNGRSSAWLGQYKRYETQLAWELWRERARIAAEREAKLREALEYLIERAGDSDDAFYGTLSTSFVRDVARAALAPEAGR